MTLCPVFAANKAVERPIPFPAPVIKSVFTCFSLKIKKPAQRQVYFLGIEENLHQHGNWVLDKSFKGL